MLQGALIASPPRCSFPLEGVVPQEMVMVVGRYCSDCQVEEWDDGLNFDFD
jgi:hypothetical protein